MKIKRSKAAPLRDAGPAAKNNVGAWVFLAIALCLPIAILGSVSAAGAQDRLAVADQPRAVWAPAESAQLKPIPVEITLKWADGDSLSSPQWTGLVTGVEGPFPRMLSSGDRILQVDGVWRIGLHTPSPFFRTLSVKSFGPDVAMLNQALTSLGLVDATGEYWTWQTTVGVRLLQDHLGIEEPLDGFDPSWALWMSSPSFEANAPTVSAGMPVPAAGAPIVLGAPTATFVSADLSGRSTEGTKTEAWSLLVGEKEVSYDPSAPQPVSDLAGLAKTLQGKPEKVRGTLQPTSTTPALSIPTTAIVVDSPGRQCVFISKDADESTPIAIDVDAIGGAVGKTLISVSNDLSQGTKVLLNPMETLETIKCG